MFEYKALDLKDFSGGMTDDFVNGKPNQGQFAENFYSLSNNSLVTRMGTELDLTLNPTTAPFAQLPIGSERINALINYDNDRYLVVQAGGRFFYRNSPYAATPEEYTLLNAPEGLFWPSDPETHVSHTQWNRHLILAHENFYRPAKIFSDSLSNGALRGFTAGLPKPATPTFTQASKTPVSFAFTQVAANFPSQDFKVTYPEQFNSGQLQNYMAASLWIVSNPPSTFTWVHAFTKAQHGLETGDVVFVENAGNGIPPLLTPLTPYYVIKISADQFKIANSYNDALAGLEKSIAPNNAPSSNDSFQAVVNVYPVYSVCYAPAHGLVRGEAVVVTPPSQTPPSGWLGTPYRVLENTTYYVVPIDADTFWLTTNPAAPIGTTVVKPVSLTAYHQAYNSTINYPVGTKSYLYAAVYKNTYRIDGQLFIDRSPPALFQAENVYDPNLFPITITVEKLEDESLPNPTRWPIADIHLEIYRSIAGGQELYLITEQFFGPNPEDDVVYVDDDEDSYIQNNEQIYTSAGVPANDPPPRCKYVHSVNNFTYYAHIKEGNEIYPSLIRQSQGLDPDSVPASFNDQLEDEITGLSSVQDIPIVGCKKHIYRIDGTFDEQGRGGMFHRRLSDHAGCISHDSFVQAEGGLFWFGEDGIYHTEGYKCTKVTDHLNDRYKRFKETLAGKTRKIKGVYNPYMRMLFWTVSTTTKTSGQEDCDALWVLDLSRGISDEMPCFIWNGYSTFNPSAICMYKSALHRADKFGYVLRFNEDVVTDPKIVAGTDPTTWFQETILHRWATISSNFDAGYTRKIANKLLVDFKPEATLLNTTTVSLDINAVNDNGALVRPFKPIRWRKGFIWGGEEYIWGDPDFVWYYGGVVSVDRRFPAKGLRFNYLQIDIKASFANIVNSDIIATATIDSIAKTITLDDLTKKWPSQAVDYIIELEHNNFTEQYLITDRTDTVLTVSDPLNNLIDGSYRWRIKGYKKGEKINLVGMSISWAPTSRSHDTFNTSESGDLS